MKNYEKKSMKCLWLVVFVVGAALRPVTCCRLMSSGSVQINSAGFTYPDGDIFLEVGQPLEIMCTLLNRTYSVQDLVFKEPKGYVDKRYMNIVNETTLRLYIPKMMTPMRQMYHCMVKDPTVRLGYRALCLNAVIVETKPKPVIDFKCTSLNWNLLRCVWTRNSSFLPVNNNASCSYDNRTWEKCLNADNKTLTMDVGHPRMVYLRLNVSNLMGNITEYFTVDVYKNVLAVEEPIVNLTKINSGIRNITLGWYWPSWSYDFPPGLIAKISYKTLWDPKFVWHEKIVANSSGQDEVKRRELVIAQMDDLQYANTIYDIRIYVKSAVADNSSWSRPEVTTMRTKPTIPGAAPEVDTGSFKSEIEKRLDKRKIMIYWRDIPEHLQNGDNFGYTVQVFENGTLTNKKTLTLSKTMATLSDAYTVLFYTFRIYSTNAVGNSSNYAEITIPPSHLLPPKPEEDLFIKIAYGDGVYELQWAPPSTAHTSHVITSYTIFWCLHKQHEWMGPLNWTRVESNVSTYKLSLADNKDFQFLISANTDHWSSGMVWASCSVPKNRVPDINSLSDITVSRVGSDFIEMSWTLDCLSRIERPIKYIIYYCPKASPESEHCKEDESRITVSDLKNVYKESLNRKAYNVTRLKPYTSYKLAIALVIQTNVSSKRSHHVLSTTLEAAPDNPPWNVTATEVTNTTINLTWLPPSPLNGMLREYIVYWGPHTTVTHEEMIELTDLESMTDYKISVTACTVACSPKSQPIVVRTNIGNPSQVKNPKVDQTESNKIVVEWSEAENMSGTPITVGNHYYEVMVELRYESITDIVQPIQRTNGTQMEVDVTKCEYVYNIYVRAVNVDANNQTYPGPWSPPVSHLCTKPGVTWIILFLILMASLLFLPLLFRWSYRFLQSIVCIEIKMPPPLVVRNMAKDKEMDTPLEAHIHQPRPHLFVHNNTLFPSDLPATDQLIHLMLDSQFKGGNNGVAGESLGLERNGSLNENNKSNRKKRASSEQLLKTNDSSGGATTTLEDDSTTSLNDYDYDYDDDNDDDYRKVEEETNSVDLSIASDSSDRQHHYSFMASLPTTTTTVPNHSSYNVSSECSSSVDCEGSGSDACLLGGGEKKAAGEGYCQMLQQPQSQPQQPQPQQPQAAASGYVMHAPPWSTKHPLQQPQQQPQPQPQHQQPAYCVIGIKHPPTPN